MAILALAEGAQNQNERGEGGSSLWVPNNCAKQVLHLKEVSVSKFQRTYNDIFAHYIGFQEGISIRQKELVRIVQIHTNTAATNTIIS